MISGTYSLYFLQVYWLDTLWECFCWVLAEQRVNKCLFMLQIFINRYPFNSTVAFISLPSVLQHSFPQNSWNQNPPRVVFQFFGIPMLFRVILSLKETRKQFNQNIQDNSWSISLLFILAHICFYYFQSSENGQTLNTFVVSASVTNASAPIRDLEEDVTVTLHHIIPNKVGWLSFKNMADHANNKEWPLINKTSSLLKLYKDVQCVYWNFNKNSKSWSDSSLIWSSYLYEPCGA